MAKGATAKGPGLSHNGKHPAFSSTQNAADIFSSGAGDGACSILHVVVALLVVVEPVVTVRRLAKSLHSCDNGAAL